MNNADETEYKINLTDDPLTNFLFKKLDYFRLFIVMFIITAVVPVLLGVHYNTVFGAPPEIELKKDVTFIPFIKDYNGQIFAILIIAVFLLTKNLFDKVDDVFSSLPKKQIFKDMTGYEKFLEKFQKDFNNRYIFFVCLLIIPNLTFTLFVFRQIPTPTPITVIVWNDKELFALSWAYWFALLYFLQFGTTLLAWKGFVIVKYIRHLGELSFNVQMMHPDRCGGFKLIGDLCLKIDMIIFAVGIAFASLIYFIPLKNQPQVLFLLVAYICASFFFFFYPIMDIHNAMQNRKAEIMNKISIKLGNYPNFYERTIDKDGYVDKDALKKIQDIREFNREISKIPVWPFDSETLWKFVTTTSVPVITIVLKIIGVV